MSDETPEPDGAPRRNFLASLGAVVLGGIAGLVPFVAGITALLDPLRKRAGAEGDGMVLVSRTSLLPGDGVPRKFTVQADRKDAWTTYRNTPVGAVYLRRTDDNVSALNVVCPHAGCFVGLAPDATRFQCPCHRSSFDLDGVVNDPSSPSPRDMDVLDVQVRNGDEIWVRFQNFLPGQEDKTPVV
jgi:menaquinol-cytochrome c reductase iron-sulfur subunit